MWISIIGNKDDVLIVWGSSYHARGRKTPLPNYANCSYKRSELLSWLTNLTSWKCGGLLVTPVVKWPPPFIIQIAYIIDVNLRHRYQPVVEWPPCRMMQIDHMNYIWVTVRKRLSLIMTSVTFTFNLWPWPSARTSRLPLVIATEIFRMMRWQERCQIWWWNDAQKFILRRGALLFFKVIRQISKVTRLKQSSILNQTGRFRTVTPISI